MEFQYPHSMSDKQRTIAKEISLSGRGLHSGKNVEMVIKPAEPNTGYRFVRVDLDNQPVIRALAENVVSTARGTTLQENSAEIMTIEHSLAALYGLGIDNATIEVNAPEIPILDGSSMPFVKAIKEVGSVEQDADRCYFGVKEKTVYTNGQGTEVAIFPDDEFSIDVHIDYDSKVLGHQYASIANISEFEDQIASCKTFVFLHELEFLLKNNLIKGGDLDNALIIVERQMSQEELDHLAELFNKPKVQVMPEGILNNTKLTWSNEPARHKLLDVIGDLALSGVRLKGKVIAKKPGHEANTELAKILRKEIKRQNHKNYPPQYDPNKEPLMDLNQIKKLLPHRPPFLLVDKITSMEGDFITGIKNVTMNESFFVGHYPEEPIMPGVLQIESMAQVGGLLLLSRVPDPENYTLYFMKIDNIKFKHKVVPGDTLNIRMQLLEPVKRGVAYTSGQIFVGDTLVMEGKFVAQLAKKP